MILETLLEKGTGTKRVFLALPARKQEPYCSAGAARCDKPRETSAGPVRSRELHSTFSLLFLFQVAQLYCLVLLSLLS